MESSAFGRVVRVTRVVALVVALVAGILTSGEREARGAFPGAVGRIVFDAYRDSTFHLSTVEPDGSDLVEIAEASEGAWSADGTRLAVGGGPISVMRADGTGRRVVWADPDGNVIQSTPTWSPDGTRIAFTSMGNSSSIASVRIDGKDVRGFPTGGLHGARHPAWSPDGRRIAFVGVILDPETELFDAELFVMDENGSARQKLTELSDGIPANPAWSPDGSRLAFSTMNTSSKDVFVLDLGTGTLQNLTDGFDGWAEDPTWSPDGTRIAHVRNFAELVVMGADGADPTTIVSGVGGIRSPDWQVRCTIQGTSGADTLVGTAGDDRICAGPGDDEVTTGDGADVVFGGPGADVVRVGGGPDVVNGDAGADVVVGGPGDDLLASGLGTSQDLLRGGDGSDRLDTRDGRGGDRLDGGGGSDRCRSDRTDIRRACP